MIGEQNVARLVDASSQKRVSSHVGMNALHQAAVSLSDLRNGRSTFKTKDLIGLLLGHGARARRSSLPPVSIRLRAVAPDGKLAVKISLK